jgi:hypothetical protein
VRSLTSSHGVWGDPVLDVDTHGNFYFFHLSNPSTGNWIDRIVCQRSSDQGRTWNDGSYTGPNGTKAQDKQWSIIDRTDNSIYLTWTQFDAYGSSNALDSSIILFSKSTDLGLTWSTPKRINNLAGDCIDGDNTVEGAFPAIGPNGEIYVVWAGPQGLVFNRSMDKGTTWLNKEIHIDSMPGGWDYYIPNLQRCNGLPILKCDLSGGPNHGTLYLNWTDQRNGYLDADVWLSTSTDGGDSWSSPIRVNDDAPGKQQFFTWMDIDQSNGNLYFVFYDRRRHQFSETDVYMARSIDGGNSFKNVRLNDSSFVPSPFVFFGDYINIVAHNHVIRPIWTSMNNGRLIVWTDITSEDSLFTAVRSMDQIDTEIMQYPNPAKDVFYISFKLHKLSRVDLIIIDQQGKTVWTEIDHEAMDYGKYVFSLDVQKMGLSSGMYISKLIIDSKEVITEKIIVE